MIYNKRKKFKFTGSYYDSHFKIKSFGVKYESDYIKATMYIIITTNQKRKKYDIENIFESIQTSFLNLAECREYDIFIDKYYDSFKRDINKTPNIVCYYRVGNNNYEFTATFKIFNKDENNSFLNKIIKTEECSLYLVFAA